MTRPRRYSIAHLDEIDSMGCSCGETRRAFTDDRDRIASLHVVEVHEDAKVHYHTKLTEIYYILEGSGHVELDGELHPVRPGSAVLIKPGCRHRPVGKLKILNVPIPAFDPNDEWYD